VISVVKSPSTSKWIADFSSWLEKHKGAIGGHDCLSQLALSVDNKVLGKAICFLGAGMLQ
jgi:hypothetical protein